MHVKTRHSYKFYFARLETVHISHYQLSSGRIAIHESCLNYPWWCRGIPIRLVLHILDQILNIGKREKATIVRPRAPSIQHPCLLLIVIPACRRIMNCIARYCVAQISLHLDEVDSSHLSTDLPEAVRKLISQLSTLRSSIKINVILSSESSRFSKLN